MAHERADHFSAVVPNRVKDLTNMHYPWMFRKGEATTKHAEASLEAFEVYDSISCIVIEMAF